MYKSQHVLLIRLVFVPTLKKNPARNFLLISRAQRRMQRPKPKRRCGKGSSRAAVALHSMTRRTACPHTCPGRSRSIGPSATDSSSSMTRASNLTLVRLSFVCFSVWLITILATCRTCIPASTAVLVVWGPEVKLRMININAW